MGALLSEGVMEAPSELLLGVPAVLRRKLKKEAIAFGADTHRLRPAAFIFLFWPFLLFETFFFFFFF